MGSHRRNEDGDLLSGGSVSLWHPWQDKPGMRHIPTQWNRGSISTQSSEPMFHVDNLDGLLDTVARHELFLLCNDVLDVREFPYANELIGHEHATPYLSRSGNVSALRVAQKRKSGFLVPTRTWKWNGQPNRDLLDSLTLLFKIFGFQSTTPASLSEKVLRSTLCTPLNISRPSVMLRRDILNNHEGGRIDKATKGQYWPHVYEYDKNKAYLWHSRTVPSPFHSPVMRYYPTYEECMEYACGWWHCVFIAHATVLSPLSVQAGGPPVEGEVIEKWLWTGELQDCLDAGYTLVEIKGGYGFEAMSNFMEQWSNILWTKYQQAQRDNEHLLECIKAMMVGLPGRFLRQPETYQLIPIGEAIPRQDIPLCMNWIEPEDRHFSDYAIRAIYDKESTALSPVGSYIVAEMRRELYHRMKEEIEHGYIVVRSYIDCYSVSRTDSQPDNALVDYRNVGSGLGQWKEKRYTHVYAEENRFVGTEVDPYGWEEDQTVVVAPGFGDSEFNRERRILFLQRARNVIEKERV